MRDKTLKLLWKVPENICIENNNGFIRCKCANAKIMCTTHTHTIDGRNFTVIRLNIAETAKHIIIIKSMAVCAYRCHLCAFLSLARFHSRRLVINFYENQRFDNYFHANFGIFVCTIDTIFIGTFFFCRSKKTTTTAKRNSDLPNSGQYFFVIDWIIIFCYYYHIFVFVFGFLILSYQMNRHPCEYTYLIAARECRFSQQITHIATVNWFSIL